MIPLTVTKHDGNLFYCRECKQNDFKLLFIRSYNPIRVIHKQVLACHLECANCKTINLIPMGAIRTINVKWEMVKN